jgi:transposase
MLEQIKAAIVAARIDALPKIPWARASNYTLTLWQRLTRFLDYPVLELSNNLANAIRPIALGHRNWIYVGSKEAWPRVEAIISVAATCRWLQTLFATIWVPSCGLG